MPVTTRAQAAQAAQAQSTPARPSSGIRLHCPQAPSQMKTQGLSIQHAAVSERRGIVSLAVSGYEARESDSSIIFSHNNSEE